MKEHHITVILLKKFGINIVFRQNDVKHLNQKLFIYD